MNGKCCHRPMEGAPIDTDGDAQGGNAPYCSAYAAACMRHPTARADGFRMCRAAQAQCLQTGVYIGPYSGWQFAGMQRM